MMKVFGSVIGLAAMLAAGTGNAAVVYDSLNGQTKANSNLLTNASGLHAPLGAGFTTSSAETINSVKVQLYDTACNASPVACTDAGSVLMYLVAGTGSPSLPSASGMSLTAPIFLGSILDTALIGGNVANNITINTAATIAAGNWWIELASGSDPNNFHTSVNPAISTAKWGEINAATAVGTTGVPTTGWFTSGSNFAQTGLIGGISNNSTSINPSPNDQIFMMTIDATVPEPTSMALLGAGLIGLGVERFRRSNKKRAA